MAKQDGWKPCKTKPEPLLPIPSRPGAHYGVIQEFIGPLGTTSLGRKVEGVVTPFQWSIEVN